MNLSETHVNIKLVIDIRVIKVRRGAVTLEWPSGRQIIVRPGDVINAETAFTFDADAFTSPEPKVVTSPADR